VEVEWVTRVVADDQRVAAAESFVELGGSAVPAVVHGQVRLVATEVVHHLVAIVRVLPLEAEKRDEPAFVEEALIQVLDEGPLVVLVVAVRLNRHGDEVQPLVVARPGVDLIGIAFGFTEEVVAVEIADVQIVDCGLWTADWVGTGNAGVGQELTGDIGVCGAGAGHRTRRWQRHPAEAVDQLDRVVLPVEVDGGGAGQRHAVVEAIAGRHVRRERGVRARRAGQQHVEALRFQGQYAGDDWLG